jgi:hypothetical protein
VGRGSAIQRALSTRALKKIVRHIALYPLEEKRMRSVLKRYYAYEWSSTAQRQLVDADIDAEFDEPEDDAVAPSHTQHLIA